MEMISFKKRASRKKQLIWDLQKHIQQYNEIRGFSIFDRAVIEDDQNLNRRQREVLTLMLDGLGNKQIAESLCIEVSTVKYHISNIYRTYDVHCRQVLFDKLMENNIITCSPREDLTKK